MKKGDKVVVLASGEHGTIEQTFDLHKQAEIYFPSDDCYWVYGYDKIRLLSDKNVQNVAKTSENKHKLNEKGDKNMQNNAKFKVGDEVLTSTNDKWNNKAGIVVEAYGESEQDASYIVHIKEADKQIPFGEPELTLVKTIAKIGNEVNSKASYFENMGWDIGKLIDKKQMAYGDSVSKTYKLMQIFLEQYENEDETYTIPKSLLKHILLQVRMIDKQNRIFSNPDGDLMEENPYSDTVGYGMLGVRMCEK